MFVPAAALTGSLVGLIIVYCVGSRVSGAALWVGIVSALITLVLMLSRIANRLEQKPALTVFISIALCGAGVMVGVLSYALT